MKYFIVKNTEGLEGNWGIFDTQAEAEAEIAGTKTVIRNGKEVVKPNFSFDAVVVASDKDPERVLFEKQPDDTWLPIERPKNSQDYAKEYESRVIRGQKIVADTRTERLTQVEAGTATIAQVTAIDAETALIQFKLQSGDLLTAKTLTEQLVDSEHKTEFLGLINTAIAELYE